MTASAHGPRARRVLVSGAGVAGPVLAYWLSRFGFTPTLVERRPGLASGSAGHAVDLFGSALTVLAWMGLRDAVDSARTQTEALSFIRPGRRPVDAAEELLSEGVAADHVELMRSDLVRIAFEAGHDGVEHVFGDSIASLSEDGEEVEVTFEHGPPRSFDLVVGADGLHSSTRALTFGEESRFLRFLGAYLAVFSMPNRLGLQRRSVVFADVDRVVELYPAPGTDQLRVLLLFRGPAAGAVDRADRTEQQHFVRRAYAGAGWEVPRLLDAMPDAVDFYLDSVSQVQMSSWTSGRVALVGDAGYATGPAVGGGTSLAVLGAYSLAATLASDEDIGGALAAYQASLAPAVQGGTSIPTGSRHLFHPKTAQMRVTATTARGEITMTMMQRAQFHQYGPPEVIRLAQVPVPIPKPGEVLVRVHGASVNGGELVGRAGGLRLLMLGSPFPRGTGLDFAGEVEAIEGDAGGLAAGDRVWGLLPRNQYAAGRGGSAAEYVSVPLDHVSRSPANLDLVSAAALPAVGTTAITALRDIARVREGERLLVRGASGGVGSVAVQLGKALGARVTGLASAPNLDLVTELGAHEVIDYTTVRPADLGCFDVIIDTAGSELSAYRRLLGTGGRMVTITPDPRHLLRSAAYLADSTVYRDRRVRIFFGAPRRELFADLTAYVESGAIRPVIDTIYPLADVAAAHRALEARGTRGKRVIQVR